MGPYRHAATTVNVHVRDVPESVHQALVERAERRGMSLRGYVLQVLSDHVSLPTLDEWLEGLERLPAVNSKTTGAEAVREAREADDEAVLAGVGET